MKKYNIALPVFKGTYGNYWDDWCPTDNQGEDLDVDMYELDFKKMLRSIGESCIETFDASHYLLENVGIEDMKFESSSSPREYNFSNDKIYVDITINVEKLQEYVFENRDEIEKLIKDCHTSYDGFTSFHSNNIDDWSELTEGFSNFTDEEYKLGFLIDCAAQIEGIEEYELYYDWIDQLCSKGYDDFCTVRELEWGDVDFNAAFEEKLDELDLEFGDIIFDINDAKSKAEIFDTDWKDELSYEAKITLLENEGYTPNDF